MGLLSFLKKPDYSNSQMQDNIDEEETIDTTIESEPEENKPVKSHTMYVNTMTGYPIDVIYSYIREDFEKRGYDDAMANGNASYMKTGKEQIENELRTLFKQITRKYRDEIVRFGPMIANTKALLMTEMASQLESRMNIYSEHIAEIENMKKLLDEHDPEIIKMTQSYERGFTRGITAITSTLLNNLNNSNNEEQ